MSTTAKRKFRECATPARVFEECLLDIRDGLWICDTLAASNTSQTHVAKPMGCAVGLIGINSGSCFIWSDRVGIHASFSEESAIYWDQLAQTCIWSLYKALQEMFPDGGYLAVSLEHAEGYVVEYNDSGGGGGGNLSPAQATEWFQKALEITNR